MHSKQNVKKTFLKIQASFLAFVIFMSMFSFGVAFGAEVLDSIDDYITTTLPDDFEDVKQEEIKLQYKGKDGTTKTLDLDNPVIDKEDFKNLNSLNLKYQFFVKNPQSGEISERTEFIKSGTEYILSTLPLSLDVKNANGNTDDFPIMSSSGSEIAKLKFVKHGDGTDIVIVFSDLVEDEGEGYDLNGFIELDMDINNNFIEEDGSDKIEIPMPGDAGNIIIDVEVPTEDDKKPTGIAKSSGGVNTETRTATWNITVSGPDDMDYFGGVLTDVIDTDIFESVKLYRGSGGNKSEIPADSYAYNESTGELSYEIPQGETSKTFTIETKVKDELFLSNEQITATNKVVLEQKDEDSPTYEFESDESKLSYTPQIISKNGTNYEGNKIKWTITGNKDKINLSDVVISDKFSNDVIFSSDEEISVSVGSKTYKIKADGETSTTEPYAVYENGELKVYFPGSIGENSIKVEFITEVEPKSESSDDFNYLNKATITGKHDGEGFGTIDSDTIGVGVADVDVQKSGSFTDDGKKNAYIDWTAVLVSNKETYTKTVFVDKLPKYLSYDKDSIVVKKSGVVIDSNNYQLEFSGASFENEQMTITFNDENFIAKQTTITYKTNIDKEYYTSKEYLQSSNAWGNTHKFTNTAEVTIYDGDSPKADDSTTSTVDANNKLLQKFNESSLKASEDQTKPRFAYKLEINNNKLELENFVVSDDLDNIKTQYATKNPNGDWYDGYNQIDLKWTYVKDSIKVVNSNWQEVSSEDYALDYDEENNELKISFAELNDKYIVTFEVEADVSEVEQFNKNGKFKVGGNKVNSVFDFDGKEREFETSSTDSGEKENKVLGKNVDTSKKSSSQMEYSLQINQYGVELPVTTIVDLLPKGLSVDTDTLKLYKNVIGSDGKWVTGEETDFDYEYSLDKDTGRNKLVITLPENNEPYVIKFTVDVDPEELEGNQISNSVYFDGDEADYSNTSSATAWIDSNSFGSNSSRTTLNVNKLSQVGNVGLANARFSIYRVASGEGDDAVLEYVKSKVSNYEGKIKFTGLKRNNTYVLIEEEAPAEHKITDEDGITIVITDEPTIEKTIENAKIKKAQWQLSAKKKVSGLEAPNDVFDFVVEDKDGKVIFNGKNNSSYNSQGESDIAFTLADDVEKDDVFGDGKVKYENGNLVFTDDHYFEDEEPIDVGEYNLYLRELVDEDKDYYAYDEKVYEIKISVVNEKNSGDLTVKVTSEIQGSEPNDGADGGIIFTNKYSSKGTLQLEDGDKIVKGHDFKTGEKAEFNFNVYYGNEIIATGKSSDFVKDSANNQYSSAIEFTEIDLNELGGKGEYELSVFEDSTDSLAGFEYDESEYRISFTVDDDNKGKLFVKDFKITKNSSEVEDIEFVNEYVLEDIEKELSGKKTLNNTELKAGDFTFIRELVKLVDGKYEVVDSQYNEEVTNSVNGEFKFSNIRFTQEQAGSSFTFRITEKNDEKPGYEYDNSVYYITYNVVDNFVKGVLEVTESIVKADINGNIISDGVSEIAFTNEYNASGSIVISASKSFFNSRTKDVLDKISEREFKAEEFEFKLELYENDELVKTITAKNDADGIIVFDAIEFDIHDLANKYTVKISEIADSSKKGVVFSDIAYNGELSITDKGNGELDVKAVFEEEKLEFVNYYYAEPRNIAFIADKILDGGANKLKAEQFEFSLVNKANNEIIETVKNDADGKINFTEIEYTFEDIGTYNYVISEVIPSDVDKLSGYTYDETTYEIEVVVADNGDGTLSVVANVITDDGKVAIDEDSLSFVNTYRADTSIKFKGNKKLDGRELEDGQFTFVLKDSEGNVVSEVKNGEDGSFEFDEITFTQADIGKTFVYTISEVNDEKPGYTYDDTEYSVNVEVIYNSNGTISADVSTSLNQFDFENVYTTSDTSASFEFNKNLDGRTLEGQQFTYELKQEGLEGVLQTVKNADDGSIKFDSIAYTQSDIGKTFKYKVSEINDNKPGYTYDEKVFDIIVKVVDNGDGTITAERYLNVSGSEIPFEDLGKNDFAFNNKYRVESNSITFSGSKALSGRELGDKQFNFAIKLKGGEVIETVSNDENGSFTFSPITYSHDDIGKVFEYEIYEISDSSMKGYTFDTTVYTVKVTVEDTGFGTLKITSDKTIDSFSFANVYTTEDIIETININKKLDGRELEDKQFTFELKDTATNEIVATVNDAQGSAKFNLTFTQADIGKTFVYTISEVNDEKAGYTYDKTVYQVEITVIDNGDGTLSLEKKVVLEDDAEIVEEVVFEFNNAYTTSDNSIKFKGNKKLDGRELEDGQFTFVLKDSEGNVVSEVKNGEDGSFEFDEITFTQADIGKTFVYTISEVNDETDNYIFDGTVYTARVVVEDNGDGTLKITAAIVNDAGEDVAEIQFVNQYEEPVDPNYPNLGDGDSKNPDSGVSEAAPFAALMMTSALVVLVSRKKDKKL